MLVTRSRCIPCGLPSCNNSIPLLWCTTGTVNIFGNDLDKSPAALKRSIGVVPQEFNFNQFEKTFDIVVTQAGYYGIPPKIAKERAEQYLTQLGLWDKRDLHVETFLLDLKNDMTVAPQLIGYPNRLVDSHTLEVQVDKAVGITALTSRC
eukprot:gene18072-21567_t